jgi:hypothetical protein
MPTLQQRGLWLIQLYGNRLLVLPIVHLQPVISSQGKGREAQEERKSSLSCPPAYISTDRPTLASISLPERLASFSLLLFVFPFSFSLFLHSATQVLPWVARPWRRTSCQSNTACLIPSLICNCLSPSLTDVVSSCCCCGVSGCSDYSVVLVCWRWAYTTSMSLITCLALNV